jgi:hypothetical protein
MTLHKVPGTEKKKQSQIARYGLDPALQNFGSCIGGKKLIHLLLLYFNKYTFTFCAVPSIRLRNWE